MFPETSRYAGIDTAQVTAPDGRAITYVRRRFLPQAEKLAVLIERTATPDDRLDRLAAQTLGDPEQFWRICDANSAMNPADLLAEPIQTIRIPGPQI